MGTSVTPAVIDAAKTWPISFVVVLVAVVIMLYVAYWILHYGFGYDRTTAMLGASQVISVTSSASAPTPRAISLPSASYRACGYWR